MRVLTESHKLYDLYCTVFLFFKVEVQEGGEFLRVPVMFVFTFWLYRQARTVVVDSSCSILNNECFLMLEC